MTHPLLTRPHLEALLVARVLLDPATAIGVDRARLSPAANALLDYAVEENTAARAALQLAATDEYQLRLADRVDRMTLEDLRFFPITTLIELVNQLPRLYPAITEKVA